MNLTAIEKQNMENTGAVKAGTAKRGLQKYMTGVGRRLQVWACHKEPGIDGILVTVGLCIIALLLCVVMKDSLAGFIDTIVTALENRATGILTGA